MSKLDIIRCIGAGVVLDLSPVIRQRWNEITEGETLKNNFDSYRYFENQLTFNNLPELELPFFDKNKPVFNHSKHLKTCLKNRKNRKRKSK